MTIEKFEDIVAWQKARALSTLIYGLFRDNKDFKFKDQIRSAAVSISSNIAEGFERKGDKEFGHFLYIAKGSSAEVRSLLYLAMDLKYISEADFQKCVSLASETSKILSGFIRSL
ncbi:MAG: four helix bundle protein [Patescibacteria group bacterium]|nr:four helix bundle protein [Patescibacteria group bacterium]MDE1966856.1 four helix bundle protein [Patescibacteria group bacterium]